VERKTRINESQFVPRFIFHTSYVGRGNYILITTFLAKRERMKMRGVVGSI
jgi:hypothetical protein